MSRGEAGKSTNDAKCEFGSYLHNLGNISVLARNVPPSARRPVYRRCYRAIGPASLAITLVVGYNYCRQQDQESRV